MRFEKSLGFVFVLLLVFSLVNATDLFYLSSETNAHASIANNVNYNISISIPGTVTGTNKLLCLSGLGLNSHVSTENCDNNAFYPIPINFGSNMQCDYSDSQVCSEGYSCVVKLSGATNAHAASCSSLNENYKPFCCRKQIYWANMKGEEIVNASIGDSVLMVYGQDTYSKKEFEIYEDDNFLSNPLGPLDDFIRTLNSFPMPGSQYAFGKWIITEEDFDKDENEDKKDYYFTPKGSSEKSNDLTVLKDSNKSSNNAKPEIQIINPKEGENYTIDLSGKTQDILFVQESSDEDDDLKISWDFGDRKTETQSNCQTTNDKCVSTNHTYDSPGTKTIIAKATELRSSPQEAIDITTIYVYREGLNVFSIINIREPEGLTAFVDASKSKVTNCTKESKSGVSGWYSVSNPKGDGILWCKDLPKPGQTGANYDLQMLWIFDENTETKITKNGTWTNPQIVSFTQIFKRPDKHTIKLYLGYIPK